MGLFLSGLLLYLSFLVYTACATGNIEHNDEETISPNYTSLIWNVTYHCTKVRENNSSFMDGYYDFVKEFVDFIMPEALPHGILTLQKNESLISHIQSCIWSYKRIALFFLLLVVQIIFLIYGVIKIICVLVPCRKSHFYAPKNRGSWKKRILKKYGRCMQLGSIHSFLTLLLLMIVLSHNSNEDLNQGMKQVSVALHNTFMDIETYIDTTTEQLAILLTNNLEEYLEFFIENAERTTEDIITDLEDSIANINLFGIFDSIEDSFKLVQPVLTEIKSLSEEIISITEDIVQSLDALGSHIPCITEKCLVVFEDGKAIINGTMKEIGKGIDLAENLTSSIGEEVIEGGKALENLTETISTNVISDLEGTKESITDLTDALTGGESTSNIDTGVSKLENFTEDIGGKVISGIGDVAGGIGGLTSDVVGGGKTLSKIGDDIVGGIDNVGGAENSLWDSEGSDVTSKTDTTPVPKTESGILESGEKQVKNVVNGVADGVSETVNNLFSFGSKKTEAPKNESAILDSGGKKIKNVVDGVATGVSDAVDNFLNFGTKKPEGVTSINLTDSHIDAHINNFTTAKKDELTNIIKTGDAVNNIFGSSSNKAEEVTSERNKVGTNVGVTVNNLTNSAKDKPTSFVDSALSETGNAVSNVFNLGSEKSESAPDRESAVETTSFNPSSTEKGAILGVLGGITVENGGTDDNLLDIGGKKAESITNSPINKNDESGSVKNEIKDAVNNVFDLGTDREEDDSSQPKSTVDVTEPVNNLIDLRIGGEEDVTETMKRDDRRNKDLVDDVADGINSASNKILSVGENLFGFRRKRELGMDIDSIMSEFRKILNTINEVEHFVNVDVKNLKNVSFLLSPIVKEVGVIVRGVLNEVKEEIKLGAKPLEMILDVVKKEVDYVKHKILAYMEVIFDIVQLLIDVLEPFRFIISYFIAYLLLLTFIVLIIGMTTRILRKNTTTEYIIKGYNSESDRISDVIKGFTRGYSSLYVAAMIMACVSLVYVGVGVISQKFVCETFESSNENGVLELIDDLNPVTLGSQVEIKLRGIIQNCHKDKSLYEVAELQKVFNLEDIERKYLNISIIEKELDQLLNFPLNFSKILPFEEFQKVEETLEEAFKNIMDSPVISAINELGSLPGIGNIVKTFTDKILSFKDKFDTLKSDNSKTNTNTNESFFDELENSALSVENELMSLENKVIGAIHKIASKLQQRIIRSLTLYVENRLIFSIQHDLGRCKPLSLALNSSVDAACKKITTPANGHWFSWFVCITISIIILIYSARLGSPSRRDSSINQINESGVDDKEMDTIVSSENAEATEKLKKTNI